MFPYSTDIYDSIDDLQDLKMVAHIFQFVPELNQYRMHGRNIYQATFLRNL